MKLFAYLLALSSAVAWAQDYPSKPVRMVVGFPPGGGTDAVARTLQPRLLELLGQTIVIDSRPGATGTVAAGQVAKAAPDGYTIMMGHVSVNAIAPSLFANLPYDVNRDFAPIALAASVPHLVVVHPSLPVTTLKELVAYLKAQPGKLTYPSAGNGSMPHLAGEVRQARGHRRRRQRVALAGRVRGAGARRHRALRQDRERDRHQDRLTMKIIPSGEALGATIEGLDLARPLAKDELQQVVQALGERGVVRFPRQQLTGRELRDFSAQLGDLEINVASHAYQEPGVPEVMILSNIVENGRPIGLADAGQGWHTDMSYSRMVAFANVLYGIKIPRRNGKVLGATQFSNMQAAYADLPTEVKKTLHGKTVLHDFNKFWQMIAPEKGSKRAPLTEAQRKAKPQVAPPGFLRHPLTGKRVLYANPGYAIRINELPETESDAMLEYLFEHQLKPEYLYSSHWEEGDVLVWEDIGTIHNAVADYGPDEHRLIKRCQVMANRYFKEEHL